MIEGQICETGKVYFSRFFKIKKGILLFVSYIKKWTAKNAFMRKKGI